jgi:hypothetical protein
LKGDRHDDPSLPPLVHEHFGHPNHGGLDVPGERECHGHASPPACT